MVIILFIFWDRDSAIVYDHILGDDIWAWITVQSTHQTKIVGPYQPAHLFNPLVSPFFFLSFFYFYFYYYILG